eukprot:2307870-Pleurochrysis_carterae.AAC.1
MQEEQASGGWAGGRAADWPRLAESRTARMHEQGSPTGIGATTAGHAGDDTVTHARRRSRRCILAKHALAHGQLFGAVVQL